MENTPLRAKKVIKISRRKMIIFVVILILGFVLFSLFNRKNNQYNNIGVVNETQSKGGISAPSAPSISPTYYPNQYETSSVKDTREFMKVTYGASIKTRDVKSAMRDVKNSINEAEGRIDSLNESTKYSYVSFVIPKSNLNNFKSEIESLTNEKLYTENSSSQNLLGQKQSIEQQQTAAADSLAQLQKEQKDLTTKHKQIVSDLQTQITSIKNQLVAVRASIPATSDVNVLATLRNQEYNLSQQEASLQQNINIENSAYASSNLSYNNQINNVNAQLTNIKKQDVQFTDNIETVNGYISVNWISLWDMAKIFSPIHPTIIIIVLMLLTWYFLSRKNYLPGIELV